MNENLHQQARAIAFWRNTGNAAAKAYWESRVDLYRGLIADTLRTLPPWSSLLEVGCHSGANLWAIRQQFPAARLIGVDPSPAVVMYGAAMCELDGIRDVEFFQGEAPEALEIVSQSAGRPDVVLSVYTSAYFEAPHSSLVAMSQIAARAIVLVEPMVMTTETPGLLPAPTERCPSWRHDYARWFREHAPGWMVTVRKFPAVQEANGLLIAVRT